jgi:hypothetical protein
MGGKRDYHATLHFECGEVEGVDVGSLKGAPRLWSLDNELGANRANNAYL